MDSNGYYSFNEDNLPYTGVSETFGFDESVIGMAAYSDFSGYYSFNENTMPHTAVTNAFAWDDPTNGIAASTPNYSVDHHALDQAVTDLNALAQPNWLETQIDAFPAQGLPVAPMPDFDAPFDLDQSDSLTQTNEFFTPQLMNLSENITIEQILEQWPGRCTWPGCDSEAFLKTRKLMETHVFNLHISPLICQEPGCKHTQPFAKLGDLERHKATVHERAGRFRCANTTCPRHNRGFSRKDKLTTHMRSHTPRILYCQFDHCEYHINSPRRKRFRSNNEYSIHQTLSVHGPYECAIGLCEGSTSSFTCDRLVDHLRRQHYDYIYMITSKDVAKLLPHGGLFTKAILHDIFEEYKWSQSFKENMKRRLEDNCEFCRQKQISTTL